jgi:hypothetical protein
MKLALPPGLRRYLPELANLIAAFANLAAGLILDSWITSFNLVVSGWCFASALFFRRMRRLDAENAELDKLLSELSPENMRAMLRASLTGVVEQMKRDGVLPPELDIRAEPPDRTVH